MATTRQICALCCLVMALAFAPRAAHAQNRLGGHFGAVFRW